MKEKEFWDNVEVIPVMRVRDFHVDEVIGHCSENNDGTFITPDSHIQLTINKHGFPWWINLSEDETRRLHNVLGKFLALFEGEK